MDVNEILGSVSGWLRGYWVAAVEPLRHLTWQTGSLFLLILMAVASLVAWLLHYSWFFRPPLIPAATIVPSSHSYAGHLRMSVLDHLRFHKVVTNPMSEIAQEERAKDETRYYVVSIVQTKPKREVVYREMRLQAPPRGGAVQQGLIQLDARDLADVRRRNSFEGDDDPEEPIQGTYDVYIRPVRWYDIRHWLMHPAREIRILIWVTLITTVFPIVLDVLFD